MRGEQSDKRFHSGKTAGSPPLARGTDRKSTPRHGGGGITPACAGNSCIISVSATAARDHPRLRGEQPIMASFMKSPPGSPPLARGTGDAPAIWQALRRITPACAGNRTRTARTTGPAGDHPRLRGEQRGEGENARINAGSPPLARGTGRRAKRKPTEGGITPACAGNRFSWPSCGPRGRDHPRLRGEQSAAWYISAPCAGSPPLARGTEIPPRAFRALRRITPACAGNSSRLHVVPCSMQGSPPLARGTGTVVDTKKALAGITPACAGNSYFAVADAHHA